MRETRSLTCQKDVPELGCRRMNQSPGSLQAEARACLPGPRTPAGRDAAATGEGTQGSQGRRL